MSDWGSEDFAWDDAEHAAARTVGEVIDADQEHSADRERGERAESTPALRYASVDEFVRDHLRWVYRRRVDGRNRYWAARWWEYDEAVSRLDALWRAWEHLRRDQGTGMSEWWRDHADHHMTALMAPDGPFSDATGAENTCEAGEPLPYAAPPQGMFDGGRREPARL
ncbi:DUF4913 domain-containing protein [Microbacterium sp. Marseille-Q6965]|uniref:DUF4913 domain-containing protein n=1 Tax=Microbacterium sp. Marseille-Q6965 TaxID=2965072 RepID=UPI0021B71DD3|nr:DUF4913 domain-containing protein [Microbacterium sp. Marseille-Q6965]